MCKQRALLKDNERTIKLIDIKFSPYARTSTAAAAETKEKAEARVLLLLLLLLLFVVVYVTIHDRVGINLEATCERDDRRIMLAAWQNLLRFPLG